MNGCGDSSRTTAAHGPRTRRSRDPAGPRSHGDRAPPGRPRPAGRPVAAAGVGRRRRARDPRGASQLDGASRLVGRPLGRPISTSTPRRPTLRPARSSSSSWPACWCVTAGHRSGSTAARATSVPTSRRVIRPTARCSSSSASGTDGRTSARPTCSASWARWSTTTVRGTRGSRRPVGSPDQRSTSRLAEASSSSNARHRPAGWRALHRPSAVSCPALLRNARSGSSGPHAPAGAAVTSRHTAGPLARTVPLHFSDRGDQR